MTWSKDSIRNQFVVTRARRCFFRFAELESIHGKLEPLVNIDLSGKNDVTLQVHYEKTTKLVKFNIYQTVAEMRRQLAKTFKVEKGYKLRMSIGTHASPMYQHLNPNRTVLNMRLEDGDDIYVY